jgi:hypothetical protein
MSPLFSKLSAQNARSRERMSALLAKAKKLQQPATAAAAAAPAEGSADSAEHQQEQQQPEEPAMSAAEKLAVAEEFLKQLGTRPLAAALGDLNKLMEAQAGPDSKPEVRATVVQGSQVCLVLHCLFVHCSHCFVAGRLIIKSMQTADA